MKRYVKVPAGYLMVLRQGDNVFKELEKFSKEENIPSANFTAMGFVNITFGFFNFQTKQYNPKDFKDVELVSMHGTIAWKNDTIAIHAHGVVADKTFRALAFTFFRQCGNRLSRNFTYRSRQTFRAKEEVNHWRRRLGY